MLEHYFLTNDILSVVLYYIIIISEISNKDGSLTALSQYLCGSKVVLMEYSVRLWIGLGIVGYVVIARYAGLHITIFSVLKIIEDKLSLLTGCLEYVLLWWRTLVSLVLRGILLCLSTRGRTSILLIALWVTTQVSGQTLIIYNILRLNIHIGMCSSTSLLSPSRSSMAIWHLVLYILSTLHLINVRFNLSRVIIS